MMKKIAPRKNQILSLNSIFVISPDQKHDHHFTNCVQKLLSEYLSSINCEISVTSMHALTDGCSSQYKVDIVWGT